MMARVIKFPKKVDFRMDEELYVKLSYIMDKTSAKRGSWCKEAGRMRIDVTFKKRDVEEEYKQFKKKEENKNTKS